VAVGSVAEAQLYMDSTVNVICYCTSASLGYIGSWVETVQNCFGLGGQISSDVNIIIISAGPIILQNKG
jgi:hypothetical protein